MAEKAPAPNVAHQPPEALSPQHKFESFDVSHRHGDRSVSFQIEADAMVRGRTDLVGLKWKEEGEDGDVHIISDNLVLRQEGEPTFKKVGKPRYHKTGLSHQFNREIKKVTNYVDVPSVTVDTYDKNGELVDVKTISKDDLRLIWDESNIKEAAWAPKKVEATEFEEIPLELDEDKKSYLTQISRQLEPSEITRWNGLSWGQGFYTLEIVKDADIVLPGYNAPGFEAKAPKRTWLINFADRSSLTEKVLKQEIVTEERLAAYLAEAAISKEEIRLVRPKPEDEITTPEQLVQKVEESRSLDELIKNETAELRDLVDPDNIPPIWLLSYADVLGKKETEAKMLDLATAYDAKSPKKMEKGDYPNDASRIEALKSAIAKHGLSKITDVIVSVHNEFEKSMHKLGLPVEGGTKSTSWVAEALTDQYFFKDNRGLVEDKNAKVKYSDPFEDSIEAKIRHREVIDFGLGNAFIGRLIKAEMKQSLAKGKLNAHGQPAYELERVFSINRPLLAHYSDNEITMEQLENEAEAILRVLKAGHDIQPAYITAFGRVLRRALGR